LIVADVVDLNSAGARVAQDHVGFAGHAAEVTEAHDLPVHADRAINCGLGLLLRNAGGDLGVLAIDAAEADIALGPYWSRRGRLAICLRLQGQASLPPAARRRRKTKSPTATSASNLDYLVR